MNEFEDLLNSVSQVEPGDVVTAEVLTVDANQANVAIAGTGVEGVLTLREFTNDRDADINVFVHNLTLLFKAMPSASAAQPRAAPAAALSIYC